MVILHKYVFIIIIIIIIIIIMLQVAWGIQSIESIIDDDHYQSIPIDIN